MPATLQTTGLLPQRWTDLGLRLADETIADSDTAYCGNESGEVWLALDALGGEAPVVVVLARLVLQGFDEPECTLLEAVTDSAGGFAWYRIAQR